jgi:predicted transcriptional regulator YheO
MGLARNEDVRAAGGQVGGAAADAAVLESRARTFALCRQLAAVVAQTFGNVCEVVVHDFADLEHSIVHIEGDVTSRTVGDGPTNLLLQAIRDGRTEQDQYGYIGHTLDNKTLRSSSAFLRDNDGTVYGAFCINVDTTSLAQLDTWLGQMLRNTRAEVSETFTSNLGEALEVLMAEAVLEIGVPIAQMNRLQKIRFVHALQRKGAFEIKKAVTDVAEKLGVSRFTVYNYLNMSADDLQRLEIETR